MRRLTPRRAETNRKRRRPETDADFFRRRCALGEKDEEGWEAGMGRMMISARSHSIRQVAGIDVTNNALTKPDDGAARG